jgi:hypothetical protein
MSLQDYAVNRDKFLLRRDGPTCALSLDFPCCHCFYYFKVESDEPCRTCDHNSNAVKDAPPVQSVQSPDTDPREKDAIRCGERPFERNAERRPGG